MKKRKIKLFASVASLAMVAAVMGVGVWAATTQSVTINSTIQFSATAITGTVDVYATNVATGTLNGEDFVGSAKQQDLLVIDDLAAANGAQTAKTAAIKLADSNTDGVYSEADNKVTYTFVIDNTGAEPLFYNITFGAATTIGAGETLGTWTAAMVTGNAASNYADTESAGLATDAEAITVSVEFTYDGAVQTNIPSTTALPTVTIALGNKAVAATWGGV